MVTVLVELTKVFNVKLKPFFSGSEPYLINEVSGPRERAWFVGLDGPQMLEADYGPANVLGSYSPNYSPWTLLPNVRSPPGFRPGAN